MNHHLDSNFSIGTITKMDPRKIPNYLQHKCNWCNLMILLIFLTYVSMHQIYNHQSHYVSAKFESISLKILPVANISNNHHSQMRLSAKNTSFSLPNLIKTRHPSQLEVLSDIGTMPFPTYYTYFEAIAI